MNTQMHMNYKVEMEKLKKKYILTEEALEEDGTTLHRIKAVSSFGDVNEGDLGGFVESEKNLSHFGLAWIYDNAKVYGDAKIHGNAKVYDNAVVFGEFYNEAKHWNIYAEDVGPVEVYDNAEIFGNAIVHENVKVYGNAKIYGNARISCHAEVYGDAQVYGDAVILGSEWSPKNIRVFGKTNAGGKTWIEVC